MELTGIPKFLPYESPASWLSRAALSQAVTVREFQKYLGIPLDSDPDLTFFGGAVHRVAEKSGQDLMSFGFSKHMFEGVQGIDPVGRNLLLWTDRNASYRFCPLCLLQDEVKYFPLHWRFRAWRWCPTHDCLLLELCPHCNKRVQLPKSMLTAGRRNQGVAFLSQCLECDETLATNKLSTIHPMRTGLLEPAEMALLKNGMAVLAAIFHRHFFVGESSLKRPLERLPGLVKTMVTPFDFLAVSNAVLGERIALRKAAAY